MKARKVDRNVAVNASRPCAKSTELLVVVVEPWYNEIRQLEVNAALMHALTCLEYRVETRSADPVIKLLAKTLHINVRRVKIRTNRFEGLRGHITIGCLLYTSPSPRDGLLPRM